MSRGIATLQPSAVLPWLKAQGVTGICADSRQLKAGDAFLAWPGNGFDARTQVQQALDAGHSCVVEAHHVQAFELNHPNVVAVARLKQHASHIAGDFFRRPSEHLHAVAVTGTNGKTSTAWWLSQALANLTLLKKEQQNEQIRRQVCKNTSKRTISSLMIGTLGFGQPPELTSGLLTTPDSVTLQSWLARGLADGARSVVMEASSIGLAERRLEGVRLHTAMFTNLTQDHLDYHGDMTSYWAEKRRLFDWRGLRAAVVNVDDEYGAQLAAQLGGSDLDLWTLSLNKSGARMRGELVRYTAHGMLLAIACADGQTAEVDAHCVGQFNISNMLGVVAAVCASGQSLRAACVAASALLPVPGRMQPVGELGPNKPWVFVDYAHTPDALVQCLQTLRELANSRNGQLVCVFGCGGDRDRSKRPLMAQAAEQHADAVWVTQDNPRMEQVAQITADVLAGFRLPGKHQVVPDRAVAIHCAVASAGSKDVVVIAGKGHETYQHIGGVSHPHSDLEQGQHALLAWKETSEASAA